MSDDDFDPWWRDGICAEIGLEIFFGGASASVAIAKDACFLCPVQQQCLSDVLQAHTEYGVFGGFARDERRRLVAKVDAGQDPDVVAREAIETKRKKRSAA